MIPEIKGSVVSKFLPKRAPDSHKGQNGRVLIVGGSIDYFGAPILAGMGALYSGIDLAFLYVPECNFDCTRSHLPDFIVKKFPGEYLSERHSGAIIDFAKKKADCVLIGPGLSDKESTINAVLEIVQNLHIPTVLDADAISVLKKVKKFPLEQNLVITPHHNEFQDLIDREIIIKEQDPKSVIMLRSVAMDLHITVLLKGQTDYIASDEGVVEKNMTGNAGMTVGGSGDVLAGLTAGLIAQKVPPFEAAKCAAYFMGKAGDSLKKKMGYNYIASDIAKELPFVLK